MADKKFVGTFNSEHEVLDKIEVLKTQGFTENDIYVVTNDADSLSIVRGKTDVDLKSSQGGWMDRFMAFINGDEPVIAAFTNMGFTEEESTRYYDEVKRGGILLYVDRDFNNLGHEPIATHQAGGFVNEPVDPNLGSNLTVDRSVNHMENHVGETGEADSMVEPNVDMPVHEEELTEETDTVYDEVAAGEVRDDRENIHIPTLEEEMERTKRPLGGETMHYENTNQNQPADEAYQADDVRLEVEKERLENDAIIERNRLL